MGTVQPRQQKGSKGPQDAGDMSTVKCCCIIPNKWSRAWGVQQGCSKHGLTSHRCSGVRQMSC